MDPSQKQNYERGIPTVEQRNVRSEAEHAHAFVLAADPRKEGIARKKSEREEIRMVSSPAFELPPRITTDGRAADALLSERMDGPLSLAPVGEDRSERNRRKEIGAKKGARKERFKRNDEIFAESFSFGHRFERERRVERVTLDVRILPSREGIS